MIHPLLVRGPLSQRLAAILILACAAVGPLLFPLAAWYGYSDSCWYCNLRSLALRVLLPSVAVMAGALLAARALGARDLVRRTKSGLIWGLLATVALEALRETGFRLEWMPGDLPRFMGVQLLGQFGSGPSPASDLAGWTYHFWNGACFGVLFGLLVPRPNPWLGIAYAVALGVGFIASPVVVALGIGRFGVDADSRRPTDTRVR